MGRLLIVIFALFSLSCKSTFNRSFAKKIKKSEVFNQNFTGFSLYDLAKNKVIIHSNEAQYFQPASNMKLFTFYAGLKTLGDSIPALKYIKRGDSLIFWGTGDPSLLHPDLPKSNVINFLKNRPEKLYFSDSNNFQSIYGSGWAWDDYNDDYQAEINSLPIYGNIVRFTMGVKKLSINPQKIVEFSSKKNNSKSII
ncbi:MAG: D-alanyl-D-alanine carboxypeptidase, partial [Bacteroidota bacterium]